MRKAISTLLYAKERLHSGLLDGLVRGGAQAIEIFAARQHLDYANRRQHVKEIADWFRNNNVPLNSLHAPMYDDYEMGRAGSPQLNIASLDRAERVRAMDEIKRALEIAEQIPFRFLIQHIGISGDEFDERKMDAAMTSVEHLRAFAKPLGVRLLLENIPNELTTPEQLLSFLRTSHFDDVGFCFDFGHAHLAGDVARAFADMREHIYSTHVHDNSKDQDSHLWPGEGSIDWKQAIELLGSAPNVPPLLLEVEVPEENRSAVPTRMEAVYRTLEGT
jgi:sugar phosphate isomerase/epimerase